MTGYSKWSEIRRQKGAPAAVSHGTKASFLTPAEAADRLGLAVTTVRAMARDWPVAADAWRPGRADPRARDRAARSRGDGGLAAFDARPAIPPADGSGPPAAESPLGPGRTLSWRSRLPLALTLMGDP